MKDVVKIGLLFVCFSGCLLTLPSEFVRADQWFDSYGKLPWAEERLRLDNFAMFLRQNRDTIGYIAFYVGDCDSESDINTRVQRAKDYLVRDRKIDKVRIVVIHAGERKETKIVLHPVLKTLPPPSF